METSLKKLLFDNAFQSECARFVCSGACIAGDKFGVTGDVIE